MKAIKFVFFVVLIFIISGISSVVAEKNVFPWLATHEWFKNGNFFRQAMENVTVINKTEQVTVNESQDIAAFTERSASSVVEIVARQKGNKDSIPVGEKSASGIIVASDGLIASYGEIFLGENWEYKVFLPDGRSLDAVIAKTDSFSNIVLLKMKDAINLPVAEFIAPEDIKTGMKTVVVGRSGFNSEISLTLGITSELAKNYSISGPIASSEKLEGVLFADFSSGDMLDDSMSGGAAVDQNGNVIGILGHRKEDSRTRFFIVPVNHLEYVVDQFLANSDLERAKLGVYYVTLSKETAYFAGNDFDRGAYVYSPSGQQGLAVISGSAAETAGILLGDIILNVNDEEVNAGQNLAYLISQHKPGDAVKLHIARNGREMDITVTLE